MIFKLGLGWQITKTPLTMANYHLVQQRGASCNFATQSEMNRGEVAACVNGDNVATLNGDKSGAKTTPCRHGDLGIQIATSIFAVWSRCGTRGDLR